MLIFYKPLISGHNKMEIMLILDRFLCNQDRMELHSSNDNNSCSINNYNNHHHCRNHKNDDDSSHRFYD